MSSLYTAKVFVDTNVLAQKSGDNLDDLYNWMLLKAEGQFGNLSGEIVDNSNGKVVKAFRKSPPD